jgi:hypothetical protein
MPHQFTDKIHVDTILGRFAFYSAIADAFGLVILKQIFEYTTDAPKYFCSKQGYLSISAWNSFLASNFFPALAAIAAILVYWVGKGFAKQNLTQLEGLFSADRIPRSVENSSLIPSPRAIPLMILFNFSIYAVLVYLCSSPTFFALGVVALYSFFLYFNYLQRQGMKVALSDPRYFPAENRHKKYTEQRRALAAQYLFKRWHTLRECMVIVAALCSLALIVWGPSYGIDGSKAAYVITISALLLNELIIRQWRRVLNSGFERANQEQAREDMKALGENRPSLEPQVA